MRLFGLTCLVMGAFAANSVLNRMAIVGAGAEPLAFAAWRLGSGALALWLLCALDGRRPALGQGRRWRGAVALLTYMLGFSLAYLALGAGVGALILFGGVQVTMFAGALWAGEKVPGRRWLGAGLALAGLAWLLWPKGAVAVPLGPALSMAAAAVGWGIYSLEGRGEVDPMAATAANFLIAAPAAVAVAFVFGRLDLQGEAIALALLSGVLTSALGYATWYRILPALGAGRAAVAQLTVPVIAALAGMALLGERPGLDFLLAAGMVLFGVGLSVLRRA